MDIKTGKQFNGTAGHAIELITEGKPNTKDHEATISLWWISAPHQSPLWSKYMLGCVHLRDIPGVKPAFKRWPTATHEILLYALDPSMNPQPNNMNTWVRLRPLNYVGQIEVASDEIAKEIMELAARAVVDGILWAEPPLAGQKEPWESTLRDTVDHYNRGIHAPGSGTDDSGVGTDGANSNS